MVNSKQRKIVTIVCIVLGVLLIAGGIIGTLLYLNSNEYRFRMDAFVGQYEKMYKENGENFMAFEIVENGQSTDGTKNSEEYALKNENGNFVLVNAIDKQVVSTDVLDQNIVKIVLHYAKILYGKVTVQKDRTVFEATNETFSFESNIFYDNGELWRNSGAERNIVLKDSFNGEITLVFHTTYRMEDDSLNVVVIDPAYFNYTAKYSNVVGQDGKNYSLKISSVLFGKK